MRLLDDCSSDDVCYFERGHATFSACAAACASENAAMACPATQSSLAHLIDVMGRGSQPAAASIGDVVWSTWTRNLCADPTAFAAGVRWRAAEFEQTLRRWPVLLEDRANASEASEALPGRLHFL